MGKKKGKKSGGKKKKGGKKKEDQMTWKEALLAYQITIKEKQAEDLNYELKGQEEKLFRNQERNDRLKSEQEYYIKTLLLDAKKYDDEMAANKEITQEDVTVQMKDNWEEQRQQEIELEKVRDEIRDCEEQLSLSEKEVRTWHEYRERGQLLHQKQIELLQRELDDIQTTFTEMADHLEKTTQEEMGKVKVTTEAVLSKQKDIAEDKAICSMDKYSRQEILDNEWLKREHEFHQGEMLSVARDVEKLERDNLKIMSELFDCRVDDLKISRRFYLTQFAEDSDNLEQNGILEMDLAAVPYRSRPPTAAIASSSASDGEPRPKSAMQQQVEDKVFSLPQADDSGSDEDNGGDEDQDELLDNYFRFEEEDDLLKLGHLELKLLSINGSKMQLHKPVTPSPEEQGAQDNHPDNWPVTKAMIKSVR